MDWETDKLIRTAAMRWLREAKNKYQDAPIPRNDTTFLVPELRKRVWSLSPSRGIWKPKGMQACLSLLTSVKQIYDDSISEESGVISHRYRAQGGYGHSDNRSIRVAMEHRLPVLYFLMVARGLYVVEMVTVEGGSADKTGVMMHLVPELGRLDFNRVTGSVTNLPELRMRYNIKEVHNVRDRAHQHEFRHRVMRAYQERCAVCRLRHVSLLDAAHIIPDAQGGRPEVANGLALCRMHHGAYDQNMLGIDPDYRIHINQDMLQERDGPMLEHGFQKMDSQTIHHPQKPENKPDRDNLQQRYEEFLGA